MLSGIDFRRKLGRNISIYPFIEGNIESANICVTASEFAWLIGNKKEDLFIKKDDKDQIRIPAGRSALIFTREAVYLGDKLAGVCLPRLDLSFRGLGCNGAPMKPGRAELLKMIMYNQTDDDVYIEVGERIAVLMFHELSSKDNTAKQEVDHNKILDTFLSECENQEKVKRLNSSREDKKKKKSIINKMKNDANYKDYNKSKNTLLKRFARNKMLNISGFLLIVLLGLLSFVLLKVSGDKQNYTTLLTVFIAIVTPVFGGVLLRKFKME
jgi:deoxycytidine triphosphate deaminase